MGIIKTLLCSAKKEENRELNGEVTKKQKYTNEYLNDNILVYTE